MLLRDLLKSKSPPITISAGKSIQYAMRLLIENKIGSLIVTDQDNFPVGIITERDIFHLAYRYRGDMMDMKVEDHMTGKLILGALDENIDQVAQKMMQNQIRHIPILDTGGQLCGIVSMGDIVKATSAQHPLVGNTEE